jgi:ketol-acid reductoisomerase
MGKIYYEKDADLKRLNRKKIAIIGFGNQGHAHALNLKDSGCEVIVVDADLEKQKKVQEYGFEIDSISSSVNKAQIIMMLLPDEIQAEVYKEAIHNSLSEGKMLMFAHGFTIHFSQIEPPKNIDVCMIAPKGPGYLVRKEFTQQRGVPALVAVHQNYSGQAKELALAYAKGIGATRAGVFETTFKEECETDLFGEQAVLCGGVTSLMKAGFETLVEAGYQPEMAYFECINEMKLIVDLIYEGGFSFMRSAISNTAEYGDYITQNKVITSESRQMMRNMLQDIQSGRFAKDWILENKAGQPSFKNMKRMEQEHQLEKVGIELRKMMPWIKSKKPKKEK